VTASFRFLTLTVLALRTEWSAPEAKLPALVYRSIEFHASFVGQFLQPALVEVHLAEILDCVIRLIQR
jgi:hypothetical protein